MVSSSLEILESEMPDARHNKHMQRARNGIDRLRVILTSLTEAANLEEAIRNKIKQPLNIVALITEIVGDYNTSYPDYTDELVR